VVAKLNVLLRLLLPRHAMPRPLFRLWAVIYIAYAVLLLYSTGMTLLNVLLSPEVDTVQKIIALIFVPPAVVVLGLGLGAMLLTVAVLVWNDIWAHWLQQTTGNGRPK
jgi:uncharacterized membrane protein YqaE (UPF0057 family)